MGLRGPRRCRGLESRLDGHPGPIARRGQSGPAFESGGCRQPGGVHGRTEAGPGGRRPVGPRRGRVTPHSRRPRSWRDASPRLRSSRGRRPAGRASSSGAAWSRPMPTSSTTSSSPTWRSASPPPRPASKARAALELLYEDPKRDLAFLAVDSGLPPLDVAPTYRFVKGEDIIVIGNPGLGDEIVLENAISRGVMSSKTVLDGLNYLQLSIAINPGNSGGPVFDSAGRVIGVATLKSTKAEALAFCIPVEDVHAGLARLDAQPETTRSRAGVSPPRPPGVSPADHRRRPLCRRAQHPRRHLADDSRSRTGLEPAPGRGVPEAPRAPDPARAEAILARRQPAPPHPDRPVAGPDRAAKL